MPLTRRLRRLVLVLVASVAVVGLSSCGTVGRGPAVTVDGLELPARVLDDLMRALAAGSPQVKGQGEGTYNSQATTSVLSFFVDRELLRAEALRRRIKIAATDRAQARQSLPTQLGKEVYARLSKETRDELIELQAAETAVQAQLGRTTDPEAQARAIYDKDPAQYASFCLSALTVADEAAVNAAKARLDGGEDFGAVARDVSIDDQASAGGELKDCIPAAQIGDPKVASQIAATPVGQVLGPLGQPGQLVLVKVRERRQQPFASVRDQIVQKLPPAGQAELERFLVGRRAKAKVTVDPRYGRWDPKQHQVTPLRSPRGASAGK